MTYIPAICIGSVNIETEDDATIIENDSSIYIQSYKLAKNILSGLVNPVVVAGGPAPMIVLAVMLAL